MSETELVAATLPQARASSTTGVMKSAVKTRARSSSSRQTAASSPVDVPTSKSGSSVGLSWRSTCARSPGASLQPQPAPWLNWVSRRIIVTPFPSSSRWLQATRRTLTGRAFLSKSGNAGEKTVYILVADVYAHPGSDRSGFTEAKGIHGLHRVVVSVPDGYPELRQSG